MGQAATVTRAVECTCDSMVESLWWDWSVTARRRAKVDILRSWLESPLISTGFHQTPAWGSSEHSFHRLSPQTATKKSFFFRDNSKCDKKSSKFSISLNKLDLLWIFFVITKFYEYKWLAGKWRERNSSVWRRAALEINDALERTRRNNSEDLEYLIVRDSWRFDNGIKQKKLCRLRFIWIFLLAEWALGSTKLWSESRCREFCGFSRLLLLFASLGQSLSPFEEAELQVTDHCFASKLTLLIVISASGGTVAARNQFPYQVAFFIYTGNQQTLCGGAIFSANFLLSAAHCFVSFDSADIYGGLIDIAEDDAGYEHEVTASDVILHPQYNRVSQLNDIALVKTNRKPVVFTASVQPLPLLPRSMSSADLTNALARIAGWWEVHICLRQPLSF